MTKKSYLPIKINLISRHYATPMYTNFVCKHPAAANCHTADGHIRYHCHRQIDPCLRHFSWNDFFLFWLFPAPLIPIVLLTTHMILQAPVMTIDYLATTIYALKCELHRHPYNPQSADSYVTFHMLFGISTGVRNTTRLHPLTPRQCYSSRRHPITGNIMCPAVHPAHREPFICLSSMTSTILHASPSFHALNYIVPSTKARHYLFPGSRTLRLQATCISLHFA